MEHKYFLTGSATVSSNIPAAVILAMVQASGPASMGVRDSVKSLASGEPKTASPEVETAARVDHKYADSVPVFSAPRAQQSPSQVVVEPVQAFAVKCGDRITILGPTDKGSWLKMRNADGQVGFISWGVVSLQAATPSAEQNSGQFVVGSADLEKRAAEKKTGRNSKGSRRL